MAKETWWQTFSWSDTIDPVPVERSSETSVWINGRKRKRITDFAGIFPTYYSAREHLIAAAKKAEDNARVQFEAAQERHRSAVNIPTEPAALSKAEGR